MKTLLVPVDFSDVTDALLQQADVLASALDARVILLHALWPMPCVVGYMAEGGFMPPSTDLCVNEKEMEALRGRLDDLAAPLRDAGRTVQVEARQGQPLFEILRLAEEEKADLILMGSHGHGALYHLLLGGVAEGVLHRATCPVMVVPSRPDRAPADPAPPPASPAD